MTLCVGLSQTSGESLDEGALRHEELLVLGLHGEMTAGGVYDAPVDG